MFIDRINDTCGKVSEDQSYGCPFLYARSPKYFKAAAEITKIFQRNGAIATPRLQKELLQQLQKMRELYTTDKRGRSRLGQESDV